MGTDKEHSEKITNPEIDQIIRGEISAKETYEQILEKLDSDPQAFRLRQFKDEHN